MAIEIYSKDGCSYCTAATSLLRNLGREFMEYKLNEDYTREVLLSKFPEAKTYPVVVVDGFNIGGYEQLKKMLTEEITDTRKILLEDDGGYYGA
jgi:glutaredoxin 3